MELSEITPFVSRFLSLTGRTGRANEIAQEECTPEWISERFESFLAEVPWESALRRLRKEILLRLALRSYLGAAGYKEVTRVMTDFARFALRRAVRENANLLAKRFGTPRGEDGRPQDLIVFAMGKLGGGELNVSSDIDLVFAYDANGLCAAPDGGSALRKEISNADFFTRLGRKVIRSLAEVTPEGFVFRVDMRLRPNGDSGPLAVSFDMLEEYFYTQGREWERFAWLKAGIISEPVFSQVEDFSLTKKNFMDLVRAFVFRQFVDYSALTAISALHTLIREQVSNREDGERDVKLGRGGIREIEFYTQTFEIIRGGKIRALRTPNTLEALSLLPTYGLAPEDTVRQMAEDYIFLRDTEHALQFMQDEQTQVLPSDPRKLVQIAAFLKMAPGVFLKRISEARSRVEQKFDELFLQREKEAPSDIWDVIMHGGASLNEGTFISMLRKDGYTFSEANLKRIVCLIAGKTAASQSETSRQNLSIVISGALRRILRGTSGITPDEACARFTDFMAVILKRSTYVALLAQYPPVLNKVVDFITLSSWAAGFLTRHPIILDELVNNRTDAITQDSPVCWDSFRESFQHFASEHCDDREGLMDALRDMYHAALFRVLVADLEGRLTVEKMADHMSALVDTVLSLALSMAWGEVTDRHRESPAFAIAAYGKLGGKEREYTGDLDLVFLYQDDDPRALRNYVRLARRLMTILTIRTAAGGLFEVDLRLRPDGEDGPLVTSFTRFTEYEENASGNGAWLWEHQALTRARFVCGDAALGREFEKEREKVICFERDPEAVRSSILEMRRKILANNPPAAGFFDIKHDFGGMIDVEFTVQACVLSFASEKPVLTRNLGNTALLGILAKEGILNEAVASAAARAYRALRQEQKKARLQKAGGLIRVAEGTLVRERDAVKKLFLSVFHEAP